MRPTNYLPERALLLTLLTGIAFYPRPVFAANKDSSSDNSDKSSANSNAKTTADDSKSTAAAAKTTSAADKSSAAATTAKAASTTSVAKTTSSTSSTSTSSTSSSAGSSSSLPDLSSSTTTSSSSASAASSTGTDSGLTGLPTLTDSDAIPTYPAASVPPTSNAPFMRHSSAPDGTVFIAVGAILGAFGLGILLWRAIIGFMLHRSVERAAKAQHDANQKAGFPAPPAPFYKYTDNASTMSLSAGRGVRRTNRAPGVPSSNPSASNLFFSPTAAASGNPGNRGSTFLPSGFYAAGNSSPGPNHEHSISLTNLRPDSRGHFGSNPSRHTLNPSPPDSPSFHARRDISSSSLNLNRPPSQRAPSAFLDDLLADDPSAFPPPQMPPSSSHRHSGYGRGSPGPQNRF